MAIFELASAVPLARPTLYALGSLVAIVIVHRIASAVLDPLASVQGPLLTRFSRLWYMYRVLRRDFHKANVQLHRKYGPVFRIAPGLYSIDDPAVLHPVYGPGSLFTKGPFYTALRNPDDPTPILFSQTDPKAHAAHKRITAPLYSIASVSHMESTVDECIKLLDQRFQELASSGKTIDLQWWLHCFSSDAISSISVTKRLGLLDDGKDKLNYMKTSHLLLSTGSIFGVIPEYSHYIMKFLSLFTPPPVIEMMDFTNTQIKKRMQDIDNGLTGGDDFLTNALRTHKNNPDKYGMNNVSVTCFQNFAAGSDTTAFALGAIMWFLLNNPSSLIKLRAEIADAVQRGAFSDPPKLSETQNMPYLQAVILEGMRLHPATGFPLERVVPKGGAELAGKFFREGTVVSINPWVAHVNRDVFGDDADFFRPERWLVDSEKKQAMNKYYFPFGYGSRLCIGRHISQMEMYKLVPHLVRKFDFQMTDSTPKPKTLPKGEYVMFVPLLGFNVKVSKHNLK